MGLIFADEYSFCQRNSPSFPRSSCGTSSLAASRPSRRSTNDDHTTDEEDAERQNQDIPRPKCGTRNQASSSPPGAAGGSSLPASMMPVSATLVMRNEFPGSVGCQPAAMAWRIQAATSLGTTGIAAVSQRGCLRLRSTIRVDFGKLASCTAKAHPQPRSSGSGSRRRTRHR